MDFQVTLGDLLILLGIIIWDLIRSWGIVYWTSKKVQKDMKKDEDVE